MAKFENYEKPDYIPEQIDSVFFESYDDKRSRQLENKLNKLVAELPPYAEEYVQAKLHAENEWQRLSMQTVLNYLLEFRLFLRFLDEQENPINHNNMQHLDKALELIKKMENSEAEVATTHVNRALSLMALGRLDEADEELKESLIFYASPEGVQSGHFGSALAAAGELAWRRGNYDQAIGLLEKALMVTQSRFGESDACAVIRQNLEMIKKEKEEKGITGAADKKEDKGGNPSHCASCQFKDAKF